MILGKFLSLSEPQALVCEMEVVIVCTPYYLLGLGEELNTHTYCFPTVWLPETPNLSWKGLATQGGVAATVQDRGTGSYPVMPRKGPAKWRVTFTLERGNIAEPFVLWETLGTEESVKKRQRVPAAKVGPVPGVVTVIPEDLFCLSDFFLPLLVLDSPTPITVTPLSSLSSPFLPGQGQTFRNSLNSERAMRWV